MAADGQWRSLGDGCQKFDHMTRVGLLHFALIFSEKLNVAQLTMFERGQQFGRRCQNGQPGVKLPLLLGNTSR